MLSNYRTEIFKPRLFTYLADGESSLEINLICPLQLFGLQSPELLRDEFLLSKDAEMVIKGSPSNSYLFLDRSGGYEVAVRFLGDPKQTLTDSALFRVLSLGPLDFLPLYKFVNGLFTHLVLFCKPQ